mgnify:CR=1 FL=1
MRNDIILRWNLKLIQHDHLWIILWNIIIDQKLILNSSKNNGSRLEEVLYGLLWITDLRHRWLTKFDVNKNISSLYLFRKVNRRAHHITDWYITKRHLVFKIFKFTGLTVLKLSRSHFVFRISDYVFDASILLKFWIIWLIETGGRVLFLKK